MADDRTLAQRSCASLAVGRALVVAAFLAAALAHAFRWGGLEPMLERSRTLQRADSAVQVAMLDQQSSLYDYLVTHQRQSLALYSGAEASLKRENQLLARQLTGIPQLHGALQSLRVTQQRWQAGWARLAADPALSPGPAQLAEATSLFASYRRAQASFSGALAGHTARLHQREQRLSALCVALELAACMGLLLLASRQRRAFSAAIATPIAALLRRIRSIRDGELPLHGEPNQAPELAELSHALDEMVAALASARDCANYRDEALREHSAHLRAILKATRDFSESLDLDYVVGAVRENVAAICGHERVAIWLMDQDRALLSEHASNRGASAASDACSRSLAEQAVRARRVTFEAATGEVRVGDSLSSESMRALALPLMVRSRVVGALELRNAEAGALARGALDVLGMLATHAATAIEAARVHEVIDQRSKRDALTQLLNRRRLEEDLEAECNRSIRYGRPLAFVMLDVDHFKAFNDSHGHPRADVALQQLAELLASCARSTDTAYRYGGEEFCILLRETAAQDAMHFAERLRQRIERRFAEEPGHITASIGVADYHPSSADPRALVEAADAAMYQSKHAGRNRVTLSSRPPQASVNARTASPVPHSA
jgi:diguanylate cyclase (GGDEF)-like protein